jgi:hypothetical protein
VGDVRFEPKSKEWAEELANKNIASMDMRQLIDEYGAINDPCCAGCDSWRWHNSVVGECIKSAILSGRERYEMIGMYNISGGAEAGHALTKREHSCGLFSDNEEGLL